MRTRKASVIFAIFAVLVSAGIGMSAAARQDATQEIGPVYPLEGAWYGITTLQGLPPIPTLDNFVGNTRKPGVEGSVLCTIPTITLRHPDHPTDPQFWLTMTPAGHGNWVRVDTNKVAYTAVRTLVDQNGILFGRAWNFGTFTALSDDEFEGPMTFRFYRTDGTPFGRILTGTAHSNRIGIVYEE